MKKEKIYVGLSGGVDSAVAAAQLLRDGHSVTGVFIKIWHPDFGECPWKEDRIAAKRTAAALNIPFREVDLSDVYYKTVIADLKDSYTSGRTPNPDVLCNTYVKFGAFLGWAQKEGADRIATGHHARVERDAESACTLLRGKDSTKDQAYFLWQLTQEQLHMVYMPIGYLHKSEVREKAREWDIPVADRPDSQGLCFVGDVDMHEFLKGILKPEAGTVLLNGKKVGEHDGACLYTRGQRHRFHITDKEAQGAPLYVVGINIAENSITVSPNISDAYTQTVTIARCNWIKTPPTVEKEYAAEVRYHQPAQDAHFTRVGEESEVQFREPQLAVPGQSLVVYEGDVCVGGGVIQPCV